MIARSASGWQTIIADLALILFMVSISASAAAPAARPAEPPALVRAEPSAIYRTQEGGPSLAQWLSEQPRDPRQRLTVLARFTEGAEQTAASAALALAAEARTAGRPARIVLEPGAVDDLTAILAFDETTASWHEPCSASEKGHSGPAGQREPACD